MRRTIFIALIMCLATCGIAYANGATEVSLTDRMMMLVMQLGIILFAARLGHMLFERIRLPGVLGEVAAGVLIGPAALGSMPLGWFASGLFPAGPGFPVSPELYGLCAVAAIVLLFMTGLETDVRLMMHYSVAGILVGIGGVVVSFVVGDLVTMLFSRMLFGRALGFLAPECLFLGVISTATSVGITARILSERGKMNSPEGVTVLVGAVVDDVLGMILLAVVLGVIAASKTTGGVEWSRIGVIAAKAIGIWVVATVIGLVASRKIGFLLKLFRDRSAIAFMALGLALILAGFFEHAGLAMIVGAYVAGISLSRTDVIHVIRERIDMLYAFLVPIFFCVMGMLIDFHSLTSKPALFFGIVYAATAIVAKIVGAGLPTMLCGFNARGALRIGVGMVPRCEIALTIAAIGLARGAVSQEVVGVSVLLMAITTLSAPPALVALFKDNTPGTRRDTSESEEKTVSFTFPSREIAELLIPKLLASFEDDGFFVHLLSTRNRVHQIRKDDIIISLQHRETEVIFSCLERDTALVNTAIAEVLAEFERTLKGLKQPLDRRSMVKGMETNGTSAARNAHLERFVQPSTLEAYMEATTREEAIDELLKALDREGLVRNVKEARDAVWEREKSMSTGMQHGIAIPHGRTDAVRNLVCAIGIQRDGIDFDSLDGEPSTIIVLALSPSSSSAPHMQFMSMIGHVLDEKGRARLLAADTPAEMFKILTGKEAGVSPGVAAKRRILNKLAHSVSRFRPHKRKAK